MSKEDGAVVTSIRISKELQEFLKKSAAENFRSLSGEISARLEQSRKEEVGEQAA